MAVASVVSPSSTATSGATTRPSRPGWSLKCATIGRHVLTVDRSSLSVQCGPLDCSMFWLSSMPPILTWKFCGSVNAARAAAVIRKVTVARLSASRWKL